jgi:hypothetical protein
MSRARAARASKDIIMSDAPGMPKKNYEAVPAITYPGAGPDLTEKVLAMQRTRASKKDYRQYVDDLVKKGPGSWSVQDGNVLIPPLNPNVGPLRIPVSEMQKRYWAGKQGPDVQAARETLPPPLPPKFQAPKAPAPDKPFNWLGLGASGAGIGGATYGAGRLLSSQDK